MYDSKLHAPFITVIQSEFSLYFQSSSVVKHVRSENRVQEFKNLTAAHSSCMIVGILWQDSLY